MDGEQFTAWAMPIRLALGKLGEVSCWYFYKGCVCMCVYTSPKELIG